MTKLLRVFSRSEKKLAKGSDQIAAPTRVLRNSRTDASGSGSGSGAESLTTPVPSAAPVSRTLRNSTMQKRDAQAVVAAPSPIMPISRRRVVEEFAPPSPQRVKRAAASAPTPAHDDEDDDDDDKEEEEVEVEEESK